MTEKEPERYYDWMLWKLRQVEQVESKKLFLVWHDTGWPGSWLLWFINQHNNFPKFNGKYLYKPIKPGIGESLKYEFDEPLHWLCQGISLDTKESFENHLLNIVSKQLNIKLDSYNKIALKLKARHHPANAYHYEQADVVNKNVDVYKNIMMVSGEYEQLISKRLGDLTLDEEEDVRNIKIHKDYVAKKDNDNNNIYFPYLSNIAPNYVVDIGKLLNGDRTEYMLLCNAIEEPMLDNWKELLEVSHKTFAKYMHATN